MFLLGSGTSFPLANAMRNELPIFPDVSSITREILFPSPSNSRMIAEIQMSSNHMSGISEYDSKQDWTKVAYFLQELYGYLLWENQGRPQNYEDIFGLISEIQDDFKVGKIPRNSLVEHISSFRNCSADKLKENFWRVLQLAKALIQCTVHASLKSLVPNQDTYNKVGFGLFDELIKNEQKFHIATLNHDLVIEYYFNISHPKIYVEDGFVEYSKENAKSCLVYSPNFDREKTDNHIPYLELIKLHGSINWHSFNQAPTLNRTAKVNNYQSNIVYEFESELERIVFNKDEPSHFLSGVGVKEANYLVEPFRSLFQRLDKRLAESNVLIISGYGFGDKGINMRIFDWVSAVESNKVIYLGIDKPQGLSESNFNNLIEYCRFIHIKKYLCDVKFDEIREYL